METIADLKTIYIWKDRLLASLLLCLLLSMHPSASWVCTRAVQTLLPSSQWLDSTFSESFTRKFDCRVSVKGVRMISWRNISFDSCSVSDLQGNFLLSSGSGTIRLDRILVKKPQGGLLTQVRLRDIQLSKRVYKNSRALSLWLLFMRKSLALQALDLSVVQSRHSTKLQITSCSRGDLHLGGQLTLENSRIVRDEIQASLSADGLLRSIF